MLQYKNPFEALIDLQSIFILQLNECKRNAKNDEIDFKL